MTTTEPTTLSPEDIRARIQARQAGDVAATEAVAEQSYQYVRPFSTAADGLIEFVQNPEGRFYLGLHNVDAMTRGFGRGELAYITGRAHSGKTQVVMNAINNNPEAKILFFTPDEVSELILAKLVALRHGLNSEFVEERIKAKDKEVVDLVRRTASVDFRNLIVIDDSLTTSQMARALDEARDYWGTHGDAVIIDFLELVPGEGDVAGVTAKSQAIKRWTKQAQLPVICLHQASRSSGDRGKAAGMGAMRYGGETEGLFVIEVFRQRENEDLEGWEREFHQDTVTINVDKNKRPPCKTGQVDYHMDPETGLISPMRASVASSSTNRVVDAVRARQAS